MRKKHHTGTIDVHHLAAPAGKDPHASKTYHANNKAHGLDGSGDNCTHGKHPMYGAGSGDTARSGSGGKGKTLNGGEGMARNEA